MYVYPFYLLIAAAVANVFSIAAGQLLLGASIAAMLVTHTKWRMPPLMEALLVFVIGTFIALAASPEPQLGVSQVRKFYVLLALVVAYSAIRGLSRISWLAAGWAIAGSANAIYGIAEYWSKRKEIAALGREFYIYYVANRITGFQSHWMTFSGVEMILLLFLLSWALFAADSLKARLALGVAVLLIGTAVLLSDTRSVWLATAIGVVYLVARSQPKLLWTLPVIGVLIFFAAPENVQERVRSIWQPSQADSNSHRRAVNLIGVEMIRKHPWTGVGPGRVGKVYRQYIPSSLRGPLPEGYYDHLHSIYVHYAAERGLITAAGLVAWLLGSLVVLLRAAKGTEGVAAGLLHAGVAVTLAVMVEGAFELNLGDSEVLLLYLIVLALGFVAMRETHELKRT